MATEAGVVRSFAARARSGHPRDAVLETNRDRWALVGDAIMSSNEHTVSGVVLEKAVAEDAID